jgi:uncharacterized protein
MHEGASVIYQAALTRESFYGFADFLVKVSGASELGDYHYEVWDTKLTSTAKPEHLIQLCCYVDMLAALQLRMPEMLVVALGGGDPLDNLQRFPVVEVFDYYRLQKKAFLRERAGFNTEHMPDPAASRAHGSWSDYAKTVLEARDHLSQVARITRSQIKKLEKAGITTCAQLIDTAEQYVPGISQDKLAALKAQALLQKSSAGRLPPLYEVLPSREDGSLGLDALPAHSPADVFFDIEGFPLEKGGLEYLWGATYFDESGNRQFKDFWAHNQAQEKAAFQGFIQWVYGRWQQDPTMHIYHYANYEIAACRRLMGRYGVCEWEVDQLLRNAVFVDLYKIVKGSIRLGEPKYSIKNVEHLYRSARDTDVGTGSDSVVVYEQWREQPDGDTWQTSLTLKAIRDYNIDDCNSTQELVSWLRERQQEQGILPLALGEVIEPEATEAVTERTQLRDRLLEKATQMVGEHGRVTENLAWLLEFHRREAKPVFWRLFDRLGMTHTELLEDMDCIACCERTQREPFQAAKAKRKQNPCFEYQFDPSQDFKAPQNQSVYLLGEDRQKVTWVKEESDLANGLIVLKAKDELPTIVTLIPDEYVPTKVIEGAVEDVVREIAEGGLSKSAITDFLYRRPPRFTTQSEPTNADAQKALVGEGNDRLNQIIDRVMTLDNSLITLQGPPGAGKSYTGKHIIAKLLEAGLSVGIASNSHKAINHLLVSVVKHCKREGIATKAFCTKETGPELLTNDIGILKNADIANHLHKPVVIGSTAFGFCRDDLKGEFDYLFIDEAGQVSVANLVGMSRCANNIVLMGDQMQLGQPSQGSHPAESGLSTLDYLLHENPIIPPHIGIFLDKTYRMHSAVNAFISEAIYEGQLKAHPSNDKQRLILTDEASALLPKSEGVLFLPIMHEGNTQGSDEEVEAIQRIAKALVGGRFVDKEGDEVPITSEEMLFVAPYNHQVTKLKMALGESAKVGSVDKFQGQEAPIVFFSLCASDASESPRGIDFLFDKHRLNVAISRAQVLAIVVGSPALLETPVNSIEHMKKANVIAMLDRYRA